MGLGICLPDWPTSQLAGRHRCVIACDQAGQHAPLHRHASPKKELQTKVTLSLLIALTSLQAWLRSPPRTQVNCLAFIRRYHTASRRASWCHCKDHIRAAHSLLAFFPFETTRPHLSYWKDWTNHGCPRALQHYWPYHWCEKLPPQGG